jgi:hypothetical protein
MKLPKYLFVNSQASMSGKGIVLSTKKPSLWSRVCTFKTQKDMDAFCRQIENAKVQQIETYLIALVFQGTLNNEPVSDTEIKSALQEMAEYYNDEKISNNRNYYKKLLTDKL